MQRVGEGLAGNRGELVLSSVGRIGGPLFEERWLVLTETII